jgi:hypothetical protein
MRGREGRRREGGGTIDVNKRDHKRGICKKTYYYPNNIYGGLNNIIPFNIILATHYEDDMLPFLLMFISLLMSFLAIF